jgi:pimeloyl-ACP methyl ester carboxylesterase
LVKVNGRVVETEINGDGSLTVVIVPGMMCPVDDWTEVMSNLADRCRVVAFHRAGCGLSEPNSHGPSVFNTVQDLRSLLKSLAINEPVVLVGHSYGGLCVQRFAREYPDMVCGVVLVDSTSTDLERLDELSQESDAQWLEECRELASMTPGEILQRNGSLLTPHQLKFQSNVVKRITKFYTNPNLYNTMIQEVEVWHRCADETKKSGEFPEIPLKVIARDPKLSARLSVDEGIPTIEAELFEQIWHELIVEQSKLSSKGELVTAPDATHCIYEDRADVIVAAIDELLNLCSGKTTQ